MTEKSLEFLTLTSGDSIASPRSEVEDEAVRRIRLALGRDGQLWAGWSVADDPASFPAGRVFVMCLGGVPVSRCWLCGEAEGEAEMWHAARDAALVPVEKPRTRPWLACAILPSSLPVLSRRPHRLMELGDAERCVAWAMMETDLDA